MGAQRSDQRLALVTAGVASAGEEWRGGEGVATLTAATVPATVTMEMSPDNGDTWLDVHVYGAAIGQHVTWTANPTAALNFKLPACRLRALATSFAASAEVLAVSV